MAYSECDWEAFGGWGKPLPDIETEHFYGTMTLKRTWHITVKDDPETPDPKSAAAWWADNCDARGREVVRGVLPHTVMVQMRSWALRTITGIQRDYDKWVKAGCPADAYAL